MSEIDVLTGFDFDQPQTQLAIIKVLGVGGGGGNAVTHMYSEGGIRDVTFALCNTDSQAMLKSPVPVNVQLGTTGLGAGNDPEKARDAAKDSEDHIKRLLNDGTQMVFITAGMGGGTGTGAAPVIARIAKDMKILTIGIVTIPFLFEGEPKIIQALEGVEKLRQNVDAILVINNEKLIDIYGDMDLDEGFAKADATLTVAARSISELITNPNRINIDFADVRATLEDGGVAVMNAGFSSGEGRLIRACNNALNSPLLNNTNVFNAQKILFNITYTSKNKVKLSEMEQLKKFMGQFYKGINVIWGQGTNDDLEDEVKVTVLAAGFGRETIPTIEILTDEERRRERYHIDLIAKYYDEAALKKLGAVLKPDPFVFNNSDELNNNDLIDILWDVPPYIRLLKTRQEIITEAKEKQANSVTQVI